MHLKALETHLLARGTAPVNFVFVVEGEEEIGSGSLVPFLDRHRERLACDLVVISDSTMAAPDLPAIVCSTRGMTYFQVDVIASDRDLHSGELGGAVVNAAAVLSRLVASLHDDDGRVAVDGFYDAVRDWPELSRGLGALEGFERELLRAAGTARFAGEAGYGTLERLWLRPTCEVNGLLSGFVGDGMKTVIPARASAKLSCRLVVDQDPKEIERRFREHLVSRAPDGVEVEVRLLHGSPAWRADLDPELLAASPLLVGFGLPDENAHAPDELLDLSNFDRGIRAMALLWDRLTRS